MTIENDLKRIADALEAIAQGRRLPEIHLIEADGQGPTAEETEESAAIVAQRERMLSAMPSETRAKWLLEQVKKWGAGHPWVLEQARKINAMNAAENPASAEAPKKKRGRPSKAELEARAAAEKVDVGERVESVEKMVATINAAALPVEGQKPATAEQVLAKMDENEAPKCSACHTALTPENSSKSPKDGHLTHIGCKAEENPNAETEKAVEAARTPKMTIEQLRGLAIGFTQAKEKAAAGTGRDAFVAVLAGLGVKTLAELPEPRWPELAEKLKAA